jgi:hypothetical protein
MHVRQKDKQRFGRDREQIVRARQVAEALFTSKPSAIKPTESALPSPTGREPRVLQIIAGPAKSDVEEGIASVVI